MRCFIFFLLLLNYFSSNGQIVDSTYFYKLNLLVTESGGKLPKAKIAYWTNDLIKDSLKMSLQKDQTKKCKYISPDEHDFNNYLFKQANEINNSKIDETLIKNNLTDTVNTVIHIDIIHDDTEYKLEINLYHIDSKIFYYFPKRIIGRNDIGKNEWRFFLRKEIFPVIKKEMLIDQLKLNFVSKNKIVPFTIKDTDQDGIPDQEDNCPNTKGYDPDKHNLVNGCLDQDKDGIIDREDFCPKESGIEDFCGCLPLSNSIKFEDLTTKQIASNKEQITAIKTFNEKEFIFSNRKKMYAIENNKKSIVNKKLPFIVDEFIQIYNNNYLILNKTFGKAAVIQEDGNIIGKEIQFDPYIKRIAYSASLQHYYLTYENSIIRANNTGEQLDRFDLRLDIKGFLWHQESEAIFIVKDTILIKYDKKNIAWENYEENYNSKTSDNQDQYIWLGYIDNYLVGIDEKGKVEIHANTKHITCERISNVNSFKSDDKILDIVTSSNLRYIAILYSDSTVRLFEKYSNLPYWRDSGFALKAEKIRAKTPVSIHLSEDNHLLIGYDDGTMDEFY